MPEFFYPPTNPGTGRSWVVEAPLNKGVRAYFNELRLTEEEASRVPNFLTYEVHELTREQWMAAFAHFHKLARESTTSNEAMDHAAYAH